MVLLCGLPLTSFPSFLPLTSFPSSSFLLALLLVVEVVLFSSGRPMGLVGSEAQFNLGEEPKPHPK